LASVVSKTTNPVAGLLIAFFCVVVMLGNLNPWVVDCPSKMADAAGVPLIPKLPLVNTNKLPVAKTDVDDAYATPLAVKVDNPVPPLAVGKMPLTSAVKLALFFAASVPSSARGARSSTLVGVGTGGAKSAKVMLAAKPSKDGGPTCKSVSEVVFDPSPVKSNKFTKNRYHSRDINPVLASITGTRGAGI